MRHSALAVMAAATVQAGLLIVFPGNPPFSLPYRVAVLALWAVTMSLAYLWGTSGPSPIRHAIGICLALVVLWLAVSSDGLSLLLWVALAVWDVDPLPRPGLWLATGLWAALPVLLYAGASPYVIYTVGIASVLLVRLAARATRTM